VLSALQLYHQDHGMESSGFDRASHQLRHFLRP